MADYFFDSSALVKAYIAEIGTSWVRTILDDPQHRIYVSQLAEVEVIAALTRRFHVGDLTQQERDQSVHDIREDCRSYFTVNISDQVVESAVELAVRHNLRAYDAVQLASALEVRSISVENPTAPIDFTLVSADMELNAASTLEGIQVEDPNDY